LCLVAFTVLIYRAGRSSVTNLRKYCCVLLFTGLWKIDLCGENLYYICEKDRIGYTQPVYTTPSTDGACTDGWYGDSTTSYCYQVCKTKSSILC